MPRVRLILAVLALVATLATALSAFILRREDDRRVAASRDRSASRRTCVGRLLAEIERAVTAGPWRSRCSTSIA